MLVILANTAAIMTLVGEKTIQISKAKMASGALPPENSTLKYEYKKSKNSILNAMTQLNITSRFASSVRAKKEAIINSNATTSMTSFTSGLA
jgi:hypothetical protein